MAKGGVFIIMIGLPGAGRALVGHAKPSILLVMSIAEPLDVTR